LCTGACVAAASDSRPGCAAGALVSSHTLGFINEENAAKNWMTGTIPESDVSHAEMFLVAYEWQLCEK
jgi:hypothetical protein